MIKKIKNSKLDNEKLKECQFVNNDKLEGFDFSKAVVKKPWGYEYLSYNEGEVSAWILNINEGTATSMHCHLNKKTSLILLSGQAELSTLTGKFHLNEGDVILLDKKVFHSTKAISDHITLMEIEMPSLKTDLVRLHDHYGRELKGYELQDEMSFDLKNYNRILFNEPGEKAVGNVCISIKDLKNNQSLQDNINSPETILLLSGEIRNQRNNERFSVGDLFKINNSRDIGNIRIAGPVKILKIKKNKKKIKAILFDFDGVLADTMEDIFLAWQKAFRNYGINIKKEDYFPLEGMKLIEVAKKISNKYNVRLNPEAVVKFKNEYYLKNHFFSFYPKVIGLIDLLKKNKNLLGIISASPREKLDKTVPKEFLEKFDTITSQEDSINGKPHPEPYLTAAEKLGILPKECVVVENAPLGIKSAKRAGMYCIAICSTLDKSFLSEADEIIEKFEDIKKSEIITSLIKSG